MVSLDHLSCQIPRKCSSELGVGHVLTAGMFSGLEWGEAWGWGEGQGLRRERTECDRGLGVWQMYSVLGSISNTTKTNALSPRASLARLVKSGGRDQRQPVSDPFLSFPGAEVPFGSHQVGRAHSHMHTHIHTSLYTHSHMNTHTHTLAHVHTCSTHNHATRLPI